MRKTEFVGKINVSQCDKQFYFMIKKYLNDHPEDGFFEPEDGKEHIDNKRVKSYYLKNLMKQETKDDEKKIKEPIKMQKFREEARKQQRQMNQATHDLLKIAHSLTNFDNNKYKDLTDTNRNLDKNIYAQSSEKDSLKAKPVVALQLSQQLQSHLSPKRVLSKTLFQIFPFQKESIELEPSKYVDPKFQFFIFQHEAESRKQILSKLSNELDENFNDVRSELKSSTKYLNFFDFIYLINKSDVQPRIVQESIYPSSVLQIAKNTFEMDSDEGPKEKYYFNIENETTFHRIIDCDANDLAEPSNSVYFPTIDDYTNYKKARIIEFKHMYIEQDEKKRQDQTINEKIYDNNLLINTDVRNIISSQKIYLIQIGEEIDLLIQISKEVKELTLMKSIHRKMIGKSDQYLILVCGYTKSEIVKEYNIMNLYEKIRSFIEKSIKYNKEYVNPPKQVLKKFQQLQVWYQIPEKQYGCPIHEPMYNIIRATIQLEKKIQYQEKLNDLKTKKPRINYEIGNKK